MLVKNQMIEVFWSNRVINHYVSKGYKFTKRYEAFLVKAEDLNPTCTKKVKVICDECGKEIISPYFAHYKRFTNGEPDLCKSCAALLGYSRNKDTRAKDKFDLIRKVCKENDYVLVTKEEDFENTHMDIQFICKKHGIQTMMLDNFIRGHKCYACSYELRGQNCRNDIDYVEEIINSVNGNKLLNKEDYVGSNTRNLKVACGKCGKHTFLVSLSGYCNVKITQCRSCSSKESVGEKVVAEYLEEHNIDFVREKKFPDCKDKRELPFDFFVPKYNLIIEFDGQHHYYDVFGEEHFKRTQYHDEIKNQYCKDNNIHLLRIPYWEGKNVDKLIGDKINNILHR